MPTAIKTVEDWLEETTYHKGFRGKEVSDKLLELQELTKDLEGPAKNIISQWLLEVDDKEMYSASRLVDRMLAIWGALFDLLPSEEKIEPLEEALI